jgi:hypothetical protein
VTRERERDVLITVFKTKNSFPNQPMIGWPLR